MATKFWFICLCYFSSCIAYWLQYKSLFKEKYQWLINQNFGVWNLWRCVHSDFCVYSLQPNSPPAALCSAYSTHPKNCIIKTCLKIFSEIACALWGIHEKSALKISMHFLSWCSLDTGPTQKWIRETKKISVLVVKR